MSLPHRLFGFLSVQQGVRKVSSAFLLVPLKTHQATGKLGHDMHEKGTSTAGRCIIDGSVRWSACHDQD